MPRAWQINNALIRLMALPLSARETRSWETPAFAARHSCDHPFALRRSRRETRFPGGACWRRNWYNSTSFGAKRLSAITSSTETSRAWQTSSITSRFTALPFSMSIIVVTETSTASASFCRDQPFASRKGRSGQRDAAACGYSLMPVCSIRSTPNAWHTFTALIRETALPFSILLITGRETPAFSTRSSCVQFLALRRARRSSMGVTLPFFCCCERTTHSAKSIYGPDGGNQQASRRHVPFIHRLGSMDGESVILTAEMAATAFAVTMMIVTDTEERRILPARCPR